MRWSMEIGAWVVIGDLITLHIIWQLLTKKIDNRKFEKGFIWFGLFCSIFVLLDIFTNEFPSDTFQAAMYILCLASPILSYAMYIRTKDQPE